MMFYKTILVHIDATGHQETHVELAAKLAVRAGAHIIAVGATGIPHFAQASAAAGSAGLAAGAADPGAPRQRLQAALDQFEVLARAHAALSCEKRLIDDDAAVALARQGLYADLIVLAQGGGDGSRPGAMDFPEYVVLNAACPVLIVPRACSSASLGERALVAWNGSRAAARAVRNALPLLQGARRVQVAVIDTSTAAMQVDGAACTELLAFLSRHGIKAELVRRSAGDDAGHALLALAAELDADMLVMGCVGHPHTRSLRLGGATGVALQSATIPVLMSQ